jgi:glycosyltransferase involved in cell wall biosynthesis
LKKYKIDLFLSPDGWMSLRTDKPTLTVIHDLNFEHASDYLRPSHQRYMMRFFPRFAGKATRIATVSEFSKKDIADTYHVDPDKIDVVYDGSHEFYKPCNEEDKTKIRQRFSKGKPYFKYIGTISRRKNLTNILLAFDKFRCQQQSDMQLIVVGSRYWWQDELKEAYDNMQFQSDVHFIGHVDSDVLSLLLGSAEALVYTSLFEGFGIPIVEAFNAETAIITSNVTSMPEVAGDAAVLVNPLSVDEIADAMNKIMSDTEFRNQLIAKGRDRKDLFSWERTAKLLWESMMRTYLLSKY